MRHGLSLSGLVPGSSPPTLKRKERTGFRLDVNRQDGTHLEQRLTAVAKSTLSSDHAEGQARRARHCSTARFADLAGCDAHSARDALVSCCTAASGVAGEMVRTSRRGQRHQQAPRHAVGDPCNGSPAAENHVPRFASGLEVVGAETREA